MSWRIFSTIILFPFVFLFILFYIILGWTPLWMISWSRSGKIGWKYDDTTQSTEKIIGWYGKDIPGYKRPKIQKKWFFKRGYSPSKSNRPFFLSLFSEHHGRLSAPTRPYSFQRYL